MASQLQVFQNRFISADFLPIGSVTMWASSRSLPAGWLRCDNSIYNIVDYTELFNELGTEHGGDGITTFAVPPDGCTIIKAKNVYYDLSIEGGNAYTLGGHPASYYVAKTDFTNQIDVATTVETWVASNKDSWYRKYPDGWLEVGGRFVVNSVANNYSTNPVTFSLPFIETPINSSAILLGCPNTWANLVTEAITKTGMSVTLYATAVYSVTCSWGVKGWWK